MPSFAYILAGSGDVFEISRVIKPSHSGSRGVTFVIIPHLANVDFPTVITRMLRGIRKYSTLRASVNEFGGIMQTSPSNGISERSSMCFGSTTVLYGLGVKILNSSATRIS